MTAEVQKYTLAQVEELELAPGAEHENLEGWTPAIASDDDLHTYYAGATGFLYPSYLEGFGVPLLEAMLYGLPCIASTCGACPEVFGNANQFLNDHRAAEKHAADFHLAALDAPRDADFTVAVEKANRAHFAQVQSYGVVGFVESFRKFFRVTLIKALVLIEAVVGALKSLGRLLSGRVFGVELGNQIKRFVEQHKAALLDNPRKWIDGFEAVFRHSDSPLRTTNGSHCTTGFGRYSASTSDGRVTVVTTIR